MPELTNRDELEEKFARELAKLSAKHRRELIELLGSPPRAENVPAEFWVKIKNEVDWAMAGLLVLIFSSSMMQHGFTGEIADIISEGWARQRSGDFASQWVRTTRERLQKRSDEWNKPEEEAVEPQMEPQVQVQGKPQKESEPITQVRQPVSRQQILDDLEDVIGPERVAIAAENETTLARHEGSEIAIDETVGISQDDLWINTGSNICKVCESLNNQPRSYWGRFFPDGPPSPHVRCKCEIEYANQPVYTIGKALKSLKFNPYHDEFIRIADSSRYGERRS